MKLWMAIVMVMASASASAARDPKAGACFVPDTRMKGRTETHWLASNPHLPLATSALARAGGTAGLWAPSESEACKRPGRWGTRGRSYRVLDGWGHVHGKSVVRTRERYEVSGCDEIVMAGKQGAMGDALLAADDGAWRPHASYQAQPTSAMVKAFERFIDGLDARMVASTMTLQQSATERVAYFQIGARDCAPSESEAQVVGTYAFAGGRYAVLARFDGSAWRALWMSSPLPRAAAYLEIRRLAIVDMDGDDVPEIVMHQSEDTDFWDVVVGFVDGELTWRERARSAAGSTI